MNVVFSNDEFVLSKQSKCLGGKSKVVVVGLMHHAKDWSWCALSTERPQLGL